MRAVSARFGGAASIDASAAVGLLVAVAVLHRGALGVGLLSDAWVVLDVGRQPLPEALTLPIGYHVIPAANLLAALLWRAFGLWEPGYQITNLLFLTIVAWLLYLLGRALFEHRSVGFVGSVLLLGNAAYYDLPLWPVIGTIHFLAASLFTGALLVLARPGRLGLRSATFTLLTVCSLLTLELTITLVPVALAFLLLARRPVREIAVILGPSLLVAAAAVLWWSRLAIAEVRSAGTLLLQTGAMIRSLLSALTFRGAGDWNDRILMWPSSLPGLRTSALPELLLVWSLIAATAAAVIFWRSRSTAVRCLVAWLVIHLTLASQMTTLAPRHALLLALPASLLVSRGLFALGEVLARGGARIASGRVRWPGPVLAAVLGGAILAWGQIDIVRAGKLAQAATAINRALSRTTCRLLEANPETRIVVAVDLIPFITRGALSAPLFPSPAAAQLGAVCELGEAMVHQRWTEAATRVAIDNPAMIDSGELEQLAGRHRTVVIRFEPSTWRVVTVRPPVVRPNHPARTPSPDPLSAGVLVLLPRSGDGRPRSPSARPDTALLAGISHHDSSQAGEDAGR